jgi:hypothetical protein
MSKLPRSLKTPHGIIRELLEMYTIRCKCSRPAIYSYPFYDDIDDKYFCESCASANKKKALFDELHQASVVRAAETFIRTNEEET